MTFHGRHRGKDYLVPATHLRLWRRRGGEVVSEVGQEAIERATTKDALGEIKLVLRWNDDADVVAEIEPPKTKRKRSRD